MSTAHQREIWRKATRKYDAKNRGTKSADIQERRKCLEYKANERAQQREYYAKNRETKIVSMKKYRDNNPAYFAQAAAKRRALERSNICECCTDKERQEVYDFARIGGLHVDHVIALINGGAHCVTNMQLLTPSLNSQKGKN